MVDLYYIIELTDGKESWRSEGYNERRKAEFLGRIKQKANPKKVYKIELRQPKNMPRY
jgi:hypothetical protein